MASEWHLKIREGTDFRDMEGLRTLIESAPSPAGNIQVLAAITTMNGPDEIGDSLEKNGFNILERYGNLLLAGKMREPPFYALIDGGILIFLTRARKTEDIPGTVLGYLEREKNAALIRISMKRMNAILEWLSSIPGCRVTYFTARRDSHTPISAAYRENFERTVVYAGEDGLDTLEEMMNHYGVVPRILEFRLPSGARFRLDHQGIFTIIEGDSEPVFAALELMLRKAGGRWLEDWRVLEKGAGTLRFEGLNPSPTAGQINRFEAALESEGTAIFGEVFLIERGFYCVRALNPEERGGCEILLNAGTLTLIRLNGTLKFVVRLMEAVEEHLSEEVKE